MAVKIQVEERSKGTFLVTVSEGESQSSHVVSVTHEYYDKLTGQKFSMEELVRRSFEFLLEREPKESILGKFDLREIAKYFSTYGREIKKRLGF